MRLLHPSTPIAGHTCRSIANRTAPCTVGKQMSLKTAPDGQLLSRVAIPLSRLLSLAEFQVQFLRFDSRAGNPYSSRCITRNQGVSGLEPDLKDEQLSIHTMDPRRPTSASGSLASSVDTEA